MTQNSRVVVYLFIFSCQGLIADYISVIRKELKVSLIFGLVSDPISYPHNLFIKLKEQSSFSTLRSNDHWPYPTVKSK